ncbi:MAG TPA: hypothetical protein VHG92_09405 [Afifellaceae bacterium]|nr:hypothetical protein [Afifellaceae bacterium]
MSLSEYLLREMARLAERPTLEEMRARLHSQPPVNPATPPADIIRAERDRR